MSFEYIGVDEAIARDAGLRPGVNVAAGKVTHKAVAEGVGAEYVSLEEALGIPPEKASEEEKTETPKQESAANQDKDGAE